MKTRIGILTGGGDCPGLNAVISRRRQSPPPSAAWETLGIFGGFDGLLLPTRARALDYHEMDGLLYLGGTILGSVKQGPVFRQIRPWRKTRQIDPAVLADARTGVESLGLRALVIVGGDGSLTIAQQCFEGRHPRRGRAQDHRQ